MVKSWREMEEGKHPLSNPEEKVLDEFLQAFTLAFRNALTYFKQHPSFIKSVQEIKAKLDKLAYFKKSIDIGISPQALLIDGKYFRKDFSPYRELASFLHKRKVKSIKIECFLDVKNLEELVYSLAFYSGGVSFPQLEGVRIEKLDYSQLLSTEGAVPQDIWRVIFCKDSQLTSESINYLSNNFNSIINQIEETHPEKEEVENFFLNIEKSLLLMEKKEPQNIKDFLKKFSISLGGLSSEYLDLFWEEGKFEGLKKALAKYLDKNTFVLEVVREVVKRKKFNILFLKIYNSLFKEEEKDDLAKNFSRILKSEEFLEKKEWFLSALKELVLEDVSNKFISSLYKNTLSSLSESTPSEKLLPQIVKEDLEEENLNYEYFYILLEVFLKEESLTFLKVLTSKIEEVFPLVLEKEAILSIKDLIITIEEKLNSLSDQTSFKFLRKFQEKILNRELIKDILRNPSSYNNIEDLEFVLERIEDIDTLILEEFLKAEDIKVHKSLKKIIVDRLRKNEKIAYLLKEKLAISKSLFFLKEIVEILCKSDTEPSLKVLEEIFRENKGSKTLVLEILKVMRENVIGGVRFLEDLFFAKDYNLRREALLCFLPVANPSERASLAEKLFKVRNFLGGRDHFIIENIEIFVEARVRECIPFLSELILKKPLLFKRKRDNLRIKSLEALIELEPQQVRKIVPYLVKDRNIKIRELASRFGE
ncbi:MAG: hypothetical protein DRP61_04490 [Candidatus Omnitrophota bacterium]|nr:MAG: hypothetical protein DRP61_04490 [Candidatus Omnitrophota bacterium]